MRQKSEKRAEKCSFSIRFIVFAIHNKQTKPITSFFVAPTKKENSLLLPTDCITGFSGEIRMEHSPLKKYTLLLASSIRTSRTYAHASHAHILQGFCFLLSQVSQLQEKRAVSFNKTPRHFFKTTRRFQQNDSSLF